MQFKLSSPEAVEATSGKYTPTGTPISNAAATAAKLQERAATGVA